MGLSHGKPTSLGMWTCGGSSSSSPPWSDLPVEIAGHVLSCLLSHDDRLSFGAVCRDWRLAAQHHRPLLPPAMPCINLGDGEYRSLADYGKVRRFATPRYGRDVLAAYGNWLLHERNLYRPCLLRDPFFAATTSVIQVPCHYDPCTGRRLDVLGSSSDPLRAAGNVDKLRKIVVVQSPQLLVAKFNGRPFRTAPVNFACFRPGARPLSWSHARGTTSGHQHIHRRDFIYKDIAFHRGNIFALGWMEDLFAHEFVDGDQSLFQSHVQHVIKDPPYSPFCIAANHHLVTSCDKQKLLMVRWSIPKAMSMDRLIHDHAMDLHVFEADLDKGQWSEVKDPGDQILFVGESGSRAFAAGRSLKHYGDTRFREGNRVFLLGKDWAQAWSRATVNSITCSSCSDCGNLKDEIPSYCVYDMMSARTSLVSLTGGRSPKDASRSQWFFPSG